MTQRNSSEQAPPPHSVFPRPLQRISHPPSHFTNLFHWLSMTLRMSSQRFPLMCSRTASHGIMPLNWRLTQRHHPLRFIRSLRMSRPNWISSLKRIWRQVGSAPPNPPWQHRYSSLRRRTDLSDLSRTIGHSMQRLSRMSIRFRSFPTLSIVSEAHDTSPSLMSDGGTTMSVSRKVMNGRLHSAPTEDSSNLW